MTEIVETSTLEPAVLAVAESHLQHHQRNIWRRTDRLLAGLLMCEWVACVLLARWLSPTAWNGSMGAVHPHLYAAFLLGGTIIAMPIYMVLRHPGASVTRHVVAAAQMLMSALLIHLGDGRIEMHFHIFGSLAFIAFYRDWRVLITATIVVAADHLLRGIFMPVSVYGVLWAPLWRTAEHAGWVIFEDIFLIGACIQGVTEMRGIATQRALLEHSYHNVESKIAQRTEELKSTQAELVKTARSAGMAEIATSVLHNVGNVLNSVNVSATILADQIKQSELASLLKVNGMLTAHQPDLAQYLTTDPRGKMIPGFLNDLTGCLGEEQRLMQVELASLAKGIEHIKEVVATQQTLAKTSIVNSKVTPAGLFDTAVSIQGRSTTDSIEFIREYNYPGEVTLDQHKVLQILINLVSNARHAVMARPADSRRITVRLEAASSPAGERLRFAVSDTGVGIAPENLTRIFAHGFTTKKDGHGFGLHSAANAAGEMNGSLSVASQGINQGATFTLEIPLNAVSEEQVCSR